MATIIIPGEDRKPWPSLAPEIIQFIEDRVVYGPGDMQGLPYKVEGDFEYIIWRAYEVHPRGSDLAGRRRFSEVIEDVRKGVGKTEHAAVLAICESHPECPVRFDGWKRVGSVWVPVGRPQRTPYIPMLAYTEEQSEDLAYAALRKMIEESDLALDYDVGLDRILVLDDRGREAGKIAALAAAPDSRDGARTTWQHLDETHRMYRARLKSAWTTMRENANKRRMAEAWTFKTTTAPEAGQASIAEDDRRIADDVIEGTRKAPPRLFYFRRFCPDTGEWTLPPAEKDTKANRELVHLAVVEASGPAADWSGDLHGIVDSFFDTRVDRSYLERVWLNRMGQGSSSAFDADRFRSLLRDTPLADRALVVASFDGSVGGARTPDWTGLMLTEISTGLQVVAGRWSKPADAPDDWEVPVAEVDAAVASAFDTYRVWRLYADPHRWGARLDMWAGQHGERRVVKWDTTKWSRMAWAVRGYCEAIRTGAVGHLGDDDLVAHIGNARKKMVPVWTDDKGEQLYVIGKDRPDSPRKIDLAICAVLGRQAQLDAIRAGVTEDDDIFKDVDRTLYTW